MRSKYGRRGGGFGKKERPDYAELQWKVYGKLAVVAACAAVAVILFREYVRGRMGNFIVHAARSVFGMSAAGAQSFYYEFFTGKIDIYVYAAAILAFVVVARFMMSQYARYFNEISGGLDTLVGNGDGNGDGGGAGGSGGKIRLSREMRSMERKLNAIKLTLESRERDARQAEQRKNDLVTYLAHDIKTPLTSVLGYLNLLSEEPDMPAGQREEYTRIALDKANRLEQLVGEFFEITRYNLQTIAVSKEPIDLYYMLAQMADEFYPLLGAKGMRAELRAAEDLTVCGDPDKLARVFNNILRNAVQYSPEGGVVGIAAERSRDGETVSVAFRNAGVIPKDKLAMVFDKFYRLDDARSTATGGSGLGLAIAKEIVAAHGGAIRADCDASHTTFTVDLPSQFEKSPVF